jgi:hypothetical protein
MAGHVLHVFADIANEHYTGLLADAVAEHQVYDEAPNGSPPRPGQQRRACWWRPTPSTNSLASSCRAGRMWW